MSKMELRPVKSQGRFREYRPIIWRIVIVLICLIMIGGAALLRRGKIAQPPAKLIHSPTDVVREDEVENSTLAQGRREILTRAHKPNKPKPAPTLAKHREQPEEGRADEEPGQTNPHDAMRFRLLQLQDENGDIPTDGLERARKHIELMKAAREERRRAREQAGLPPEIYSAGISPDSWEWLGPGNIGGRIRSIVIHPNEPNRMWVGSVGGGIWRTTDGGAGWEPVNDFMANLAVTTMVMDPTDSNIMYAGTGEGWWGTAPDGFSNGDGIQGGGIFRSTDGGETWNALGSTVGNSNFFYVNRLTISPDGNRLLAATNNGIHRATSIDNFASWSQRTAIRAVDIDFQPNDSSRAIAGEFGAARFSTNVGQIGETWTPAQFSTDGGVTFVPITGRVELAYAPSLGGGLIYALVDQNNGEVYRSTNGGQTYTRVNTGTNFFLSQAPCTTSTTSTGFYNNIVWVNPQDPTFVIVGGVDLWRSTDSGNTFTSISQWCSANSAHADHHVIVAHPGFNNDTNTIVYFGNDGGIYRADDVSTVTQTAGWTELNNNLGITQFYGGAGNSATGVIIGGAQDNGTLRFSGDAEGWTPMGGGDGGFCAADQTNTNYLYGELPNLGVVRSTDGGLTSARIDAGIVDACPPPATCTPSANFIAPIALDPNDTNTLLAGGISLWRSTDVKVAPPAAPTWNVIKTPTAASSPISAIEISPSISNLIVVGHNDGSIFRTTNGTATPPNWTQIDTAAVPNRIVTRLVIDNTRTTNWIYATFGGFSPDNIYRTTDNGTTWEDVTGTGATGLPNVPVRALAYHPDRPDLLYAGTEVGIFTSEDAGATWDVNQDGPANVSVDEIFFMDGEFPLGAVLVAVTHGRGIYRVGDVVPPPIVTTADDNGNDISPPPGSLREARMIVDLIDDTGGIVNIRFAIPGPGVKTINLQKALPAIDSRVFIDGWSQGGAGYTGPPLIELNGQFAQPATPGGKVTGLTINSAGSGSRVRGLIINRFTGNGIELFGASNTIIEGCYIGTDSAGAARAPNGDEGIRIGNGSGNRIGRPGAGLGNVISGNGVAPGAGDGIEIVASSSSGNIVQNNLIGLNAAGTAILHNTGSGVHIIGAPGTIIGGPGAETRNILSGGAVGTGSINGNGVHIEGSTASGTLITGNYIGTNAAGTADLGNNGSGILINNAPNTTIGGLTLIGTGLNERNVISGNNNNAQIYVIGSSATGTRIIGNYVGLNATGDARIETNGIIGIRIESSNNRIGGTNPGEGNVISGNGIGIDFNQQGASSNIVQGNFIGTDKTGTVDLGNSTGINILRGSNNLIGGPSPAARNLISGNDSSGITIAGDNANPAEGNLIRGNYIGTNAAGTAALGNGAGIVLAVRNVTVGGTTLGEGNLISGNGNSFGTDGIVIGGSLGTGIVVQGNLIGTNAAGTAALGNTGNGILINGFVSGVTIGGASPGERNVIAANGQYGINLGGTGGNVVKGNLIGTDATGTVNLRNTLSGINVASDNNVIGGTNPGEGNLIAFNGVDSNRSGIQILDGGATGNTIRGNSIFSNAGLGIDINDLGLTANDSCDSDTGANNRQNFPVLSAAVNGTGNIRVEGTLNSTASSTFTLDFYSNPACDTSGNGEGKTYLGSAMVMTAANCIAGFTGENAITLANVTVPAGQFVTATATDAAGNTSEFSACITVTGVCAVISPASQSFTRAGGSGSVNVTAAAGCNWTATSNAAWIIIVSEPGGAGNGVVSYEVRENFDAASRTGTLTIAEQTFTVTQSGNCTYSIAPAQRSHPAAGGAGTINVIADPGCNWTAVSNAAWITITAGNGTGNGVVNYTVAANPGPGGRNSTITAGGRIFTVKQKG